MRKFQTVCPNCGLEELKLRIITFTNVDQTTLDGFCTSCGLHLVGRTNLMPRGIL